MGLSEETVEEFREGKAQLTVELYYLPNVRIHSQYRYLNQLDTIMIPLDGRHAYRSLVFGLTNAVPAAGALNYDNNEMIANTLAANNICMPGETALD